MSNLLVAENICKSYGNFKALQDVSIAVPQGSIFGLLGPNGAGKTSLIRIINQITVQDKGSIFFDGKPLDVNDVFSIGYLPEERGLYKSMKVGEQVLYLAQLKGLSKEEAKRRLKYWFDKFEINSWWDKKVQELSKGMAQKIQFITTVMHKPKLLIFDEPFSGFDPINANLIKDEILKLKEEGSTIIFSTHRMESVEELCEYIALIDKSKKIIDGKLSEIKMAFKSGLFEVSLLPNHEPSVVASLSEKYNVLPSKINPLGNEVCFQVQVSPGESVNELLIFISSLGIVSHFSEVIPSVNDIFIQAVNKNSNYE